MYSNAVIIMLLHLSFVSLVRLTTCKGDTCDGVQRTDPKLRKAYANFVEGIYFHLKDENTLNISKVCRRETRLLFTLAEEGDKEAMKFLEATTKPESDMQETGFASYGSYSQCWKSHIQSASLRSFGKHCLVETNSLNLCEKEQDSLQTNWFPTRKHKRCPSFGICIPSACDEKDVQLAVNQSWNKYIDNGDSHLFACSAQPKLSNDPPAIASVVLIALLVAFVLFATVYDMMHLKYGRYPSKQKQGSSTSTGVPSTENVTHSFLEKCLFSFSARRNLTSLLVDERSSREKNISIFHAMSAIAVWAQLLYHSYILTAVLHFFRSNERAMPFLAPSELQTVMFCTVGVEVFFFKSGFFLTRKAVVAMDPGREFNIVYFVIRRMLRYIPTMLITIILTAGIGRHELSKRDWSFGFHIHNYYGRKNWWYPLTFLNNFLPFENEGLLHMWHAAADFQCYIIALPILLLLVRYKRLKYAYIMMAITFVTSHIFTFVSAREVFQLAYAGSMFNTDFADKYAGDIYTKPFCHIGPYFLGMSAAYITLKKPEVHMTKVQVALCWILICVLLLGVPFGSSVFHHYGPTGDALYHTFGRTVWTLGCFFWILLATYGYAGFVNAVFQWRGFLIISRLSYCFYLCHMFLVYSQVCKIGSYHEVSRWNVMLVFFKSFIPTHLFAMVIWLAVENPFTTLISGFRTGKTKYL